MAVIALGASILSISATTQTLAQSNTTQSGSGNMAKPNDNNTTHDANATTEPRYAARQSDER